MFAATVFHIEHVKKLWHLKQKQATKKKKIKDRWLKYSYGVISWFWLELRKWKILNKLHRLLQQMLPSSVQKKKFWNTNKGHSKWMSTKNITCCLLQLSIPLLMLVLNSSNKFKGESGSILCMVTFSLMKTQWLCLYRDLNSAINTCKMVKQLTKLQFKQTSTTLGNQKT